jgi:hypothetical protein
VVPAVLTALSTAEVRVRADAARARPEGNVVYVAVIAIIGLVYARALLEGLM